MMAIRPELIKARGRKSFPALPRFEILADSERYLPSGVIGDPTAGSAEKGRMINKYVIKETTKLVQELKR
jgi:creatinine amidohydrolase/Fe(II)-dependent formamide hydrolase-like protein